MLEIGQFFYFLNFGKHEPVTNTWGPLLSVKKFPKVGVRTLALYPLHSFQYYIQLFSPIKPKGGHHVVQMQGTSEAAPYRGLSLRQSRSLAVFLR